MNDTEKDQANGERPPKPEGNYEWFEGKWTKVKNGDRMGWWRYHDHYNRDGYCDDPARGY